MSIFDGGIYQQAIDAHSTPSAYTLVLSAVGTYTFTVPAGVYSLQVSCIGAGGGGGGTSSGGGMAGGGGGGYAYSNISVQPGENYTYQVGTGGIGQLNNPGTSGSSSFFGYYGANEYTNVIVRGAGGMGYGGGGGNEWAGYTALTNVGQVTYPGGNAAAGSFLNPSKTGGGGGAAAQTGIGNSGSQGDGAGGPATGGAAKLQNGGAGGNGYPLSPVLALGQYTGNGSPGSNYGGGGGGGGNAQLHAGNNTWGGNGAQGLVIISYTI